MVQRLVRLIVIVGLFFLIGGFFKPQSIQAAYIVNDLSGVREVYDDECRDPSTCVGACYCEIDFKIDGGAKRSYKWMSFNTFDDLPLFEVLRKSVDDKPYNRYPLLYSSNENGCDIKVGEVQWYGGSRDGEDFAKKCNYLDPFCCCRNQGGRLSDCSRAVDYDQEGDALKFTPSCASFGQDYRPFTGTTYPKYKDVIARGAGCQAFQARVNQEENLRDAEDQTQQDALQGNINLTQEASVLNQTKFRTITEVIAQIINVFLAFIGSFALALYVWAGILWMTAAGNGDRIDKAKTIIVWTTLGVVAMLGSSLIVKFIFDTVG